MLGVESIIDNITEPAFSPVDPTESVHCRLFVMERNDGGLGSLRESDEFIKCDRYKTRNGDKIRPMICWIRRTVLISQRNVFH